MAKSRHQTQQTVPRRPPCPNCSWGLAHSSRSHIHMVLARGRLMRHFIRAGVCANLSAFPTAHVPTRLLTIRTGANHGISFGTAYLNNLPLFQRHRCRPGFWPTGRAEHSFPSQGCHCLAVALIARGRGSTPRGAEEAAYSRARCR